MRVLKVFTKRQTRSRLLFVEVINKLLLKDSMWFLNFHSVYVLLIAIVLVRILLNNSNFATLVTLSLSSFLSFTFFDNLLAFSPLVFFFLKKYLLAFLTWLKTFFLNLKESFFFGNKEKEKKNVLMKGNEEPVPISRERSNVQQDGVSTASQSPQVPHPLRYIQTQVGDLQASDNSNCAKIVRESVQQTGSKLETFDLPGNLPTFKRNSCHTPNSPSEETLGRTQAVVWFGSGLCAFTLLSTTQIAWVILRKLNYTQELVKKLTDKGWPKFLFLWLHHPNPGPAGEKPLFNLMVAILVGNILILYTLMKMMYLVS